MFAAVRSNHYTFIFHPGACDVVSFDYLSDIIIIVTKTVTTKLRSVCRRTERGFDGARKLTTLLIKFQTIDIFNDGALQMTRNSDNYTQRKKGSEERRQLSLSSSLDGNIHHIRMSNYSRESEHFFLMLLHYSPFTALPCSLTAFFAPLCRSLTSLLRAAMLSSTA